MIPVGNRSPTIARGSISREFAGAGGLNGARPPAKGLYKGSPIFRIIHLSQRVLRRNASPTLDPSSRLRNVPPGRTSPSRNGSFTEPVVTVIPLASAPAAQLEPPR